MLRGEHTLAGTIVARRGRDTRLRRVAHALRGSTHPTVTNSKLDVLPSSCLLMCICTCMGIHIHATTRRSHTSPTCNGQPINRQLSVPAYAQAHTPVHLHSRKHAHPHCLILHPSPALPSVVGSKSFLTSMLQQLSAGWRMRNTTSELVWHSSAKHQPGVSCGASACRATSTTRAHIGRH